jgi:hypothetical protein
MLQDFDVLPPAFDRLNAFKVQFEPLNDDGKTARRMPASSKPVNIVGAYTLRVQLSVFMAAPIALLRQKS